MTEYAEIDGLRHICLGLDLPSSAVVAASPQTESEALQCLQKQLALHATDPLSHCWRSNDDTDWLLRFLRARKGRVDAATRLLLNYDHFRRDNAALFASYNTHSPPVRAALRDGSPGVLAERDAAGRRVLLLFPARWRPELYDSGAILRALLLSLDRLLEDADNQHRGFVLVVDFSGFSARQCSALPPRTLRLLVAALQDCYPARVAAVHVTNQPWFVDALLVVVRSLLKNKASRRVHVHGNNMAALYDHLTRRILPTELGGDAPPYDSRRWAAIMIDGAT